jgi:hypothetical protein
MWCLEKWYIFLLFHKKVFPHYDFEDCGCANLVPTPHLTTHVKIKLTDSLSLSLSLFLSLDVQSVYFGWLLAPQLFLGGFEKV